MKCPQCQKENKQSKVFIGPSTMTCLMHQIGYYNEEGAFIRNPDPNTYCTQYRCSEGHKFAISKKEGREDKITLL